MITWLIGDNSFDINEAKQAIEQSFTGEAELFDGTELSLEQLPNVLTGIHLFSPQRLVCIKHMSENKALWEKFPDWLPRIPDTVHVVLIDTKPDKRTAAYKAVVAVADVRQFPAWTDRDRHKATPWLMKQATTKGLTLTRSQAERIVQRVGIDQWQLSLNLEKLLLYDELSEERIDAVTVAQPHENVFEMLQISLQGTPARIHEAVADSSLQQDPYAFFALLSSQVLTMAALVFEDQHSAVKDFAINPYVARSLRQRSRSLTKQHIHSILDVVAKTDADIKRSRAEPWLLIEKTLLEIHEIVS